MIIKENLGSISAIPWMMQGSMIDHNPVQVNLSIKAYCIKYNCPNPKRKIQTLKYSKTTLQEIWEADNLQQQQEHERKPNTKLINKTQLAKADLIRTMMQREINKSQSKGTSLTMSNINEILRNIVEEVCPLQAIEPKKPWIKTETIHLISRQRQLWNIARMIGLQIQLHGWETRFRELDTILKLNPTKIPTEVESEVLNDIITNNNINIVQAARIAWKQWKEAKKESDYEIRQNKKEYLENILKEAQQATNANLTGALWKSINKLSRHRPKNITALQTKEGKMVHNYPRRIRNHKRTSQNRLQHYRQSEQRR